MLETAGRCTAEHEQGRRQHTAGIGHRARQPMAAMAMTARQQMGKDNEIERPHRRGRIKQTPQRRTPEKTPAIAGPQRSDVRHNDRGSRTASRRNAMVADRKRKKA